MIVAVWAAVAYLALALVTALGTRLGIGHVLPDPTVAAVVFLAFRRTPVQVALVALIVGYLAGRQAAAPVGLHETALVLCALTVYFGAGNLAGSGARFVALTTGGAAMLYHLLIYLVAQLFGGDAHFAGWATASLLPTGAATAVLAWACHSSMAALDRRLSPAEHEELAWH